MSARDQGQGAAGPDWQADLLVYGATPGGIACAVRAAREGLAVVLISPWRHLGGLLSSGLSTMDTLYAGPRAPLYDELRASIHTYYRERYGADSEAYRASLPGYAKTKFEAHVAEHLCEALLATAPGLRLLREYYPVAVDRAERLVRSVTLAARTGEARCRVQARSYADCSYEGDLAALAGVPWRVGREARATFGEEHAGVIFMCPVPWPPIGVDPAYLAAYRRLNLVHYDRWYEIIAEASTGAADPAVQAYNLRTVLTRDPANRLPVTRPANYDRADLVRRLASDVNWSDEQPGTPLPNHKTYWNLPELVGRQTAYVTGDWATREALAAEHAQVTLTLLYFLQTDESVPEAKRLAWQQWGLPKDEFAEHGHLPYELYVREARRIVGRAIFTEHDARPAAGLPRAPIQGASISITEWFLDSHACTPRRQADSLWEGELLLNNLTVPGQVAFETLLPEGLDNLLVPVCQSSSHIGWGAIRLEPTWMSLGEAAAWAVVLAQRQGLPPAQVGRRALVRHLAEQRVMLSFFNDVAAGLREPWYPALQYLGCLGYFGSYDARPHAPLGQPLANAWAHHTAQCLRGELRDYTAAARANWQAEQAPGEGLSALAFAAMLDAQCPGGHFASLVAAWGWTSPTAITRAEAGCLLYARLP